MLSSKPDLMYAVRARFAPVDTCPFEGPRVFFENAGGALTLKSVVETSAKMAAIPDNQGRDNPASREGELSDFKVTHYPEVAQVLQAMQEITEGAV